MKKHSSAVHSSARACVSVLLSITLASGLFPARVFATDASAAIASSTLTTNAFAETTPTLLDVAATASADDVAASPAEVKFSADPAPATDATLTAGWNQLGTCECASMTPACLPFVLWATALRACWIRGALAMRHGRPAKIRAPLSRRFALSRGCLRLRVALCLPIAHRWFRLTCRVWTSLG